MAHHHNCHTLPRGVLQSPANCLKHRKGRYFEAARTKYGLIDIGVVPGYFGARTRAQLYMVGEVRKSYLDKFSSMIRTVGS